MTFTYAGPSVAAAFVTGAFNEQLGFATEAFETHRQGVKDLEGILPEDTEFVTPPFTLTKSAFDSWLSTKQKEFEGFADWKAVIKAKDRWQEDLSDYQQQVSETLAEYYRTAARYDASYDLMGRWIEKMYTEGGAGLAPHVEDQIWQRERSRLLTDAFRAKDEALGLWAGRGYPLPPGALVGTVNAIDKDARDKIAESSRLRAIEAAKTELDDMKWGLDRVLEARKNVTQGAADLLRRGHLETLAGIEQGKLTIQQQLAPDEEAMRIFKEYKTYLDYIDSFDLRKLDADLAEANAKVGAKKWLVEEQEQILLATSQQLATQAAAALNALSAHASYSGSD